MDANCIFKFNVPVYDNIKKFILIVKHYSGNFTW